MIHVFVEMSHSLLSSGGLAKEAEKKYMTDG